MSASELWSSAVVEVGAKAVWSVGPLSLSITRTPTEWLVDCQEGEDPLSVAASFELKERDTLMEECAVERGRLRRFVAREGEFALLLTPLLADRAVVARPETPLHLLEGDEVTLYLGSQLTVELRAGASGRRLLEQPTFRLSDTWFGPSPQRGELCYSSRTMARTALDRLPSLPARAVTQVRLKNAMPDALVFERLKVPVTALSLFRAEAGRHWTQGLNVSRVGDGFEVSVEPAPPQEAGPVVWSGGPRSAGPSVFKRALHMLVG